MCQSDLNTASLRSLIAGLNLLMSNDIGDDAVRCAIISKQLLRVLHPQRLPVAACLPAAEGYARHLLHDDPQGRFSIGSFVWKPGQATPIHDHRCWGVMGVVKGGLVSENFQAGQRGELLHTSSVELPAGFTAWLSPAAGDIHRIANRATEATAISIHVYGAPFSAICRNQYDEATGAAVPFAPAVAAAAATGT